MSLSVCLSLFHVSLSFLSRVSHSLSTLSVCLSVCLSVSIIWHRKSWVTIGNSLIISRSQTLQDTLCCFQMNYTLVLYKLTQLAKAQGCDLRGRPLSQFVVGNQGEGCDLGGRPLSQFAVGNQGEGCDLRGRPLSQFAVGNQGRPLSI